MRSEYLEYIGVVTLMGSTETMGLGMVCWYILGAPFGFIGVSVHASSFLIEESIAYLHALPNWTNQSYGQNRHTPLPPETLLE